MLPGMRALASLLLLSISAPDVHASVLIRDRTPIAWYLIGPSSIDADAIRERADAAVRVRTRLRIVAVEQLGVPRRALERCGGGTNLSCWVRSIRPSDVRLRAGTFGDDLTLADPKEPVPYLIIVTVHPGGRLAVLLIDLDRAVRAYDHVSTSDEGWKERVESLMYQDAVYSDFAEVKAGADPEALTFFERFFDTKVRGLFESARHWRENGSITIETPHGGLMIGIDQDDAGVTVAGRTEIDGVTVGERRVHLLDPNGLVGHAGVPVQVERGRSTVLNPTFSTGPSLVPTVRTVTLWTGIVTAAAGVGLLVHAFTAPQTSHDILTCPGGDCPGADPPFSTFSGDPEGVPIAPIALGLLGAGAGWSLGTLIGDDTELPWIAWLIGAGAGGAALGMTWALD